MGSSSTTKWGMFLVPEPSLTTRGHDGHVHHTIWGCSISNTSQSQQRQRAAHGHGRCSGDQVSFHPFKSIDSLLLASVVKQVCQVITKVGHPAIKHRADQVVWHTLKGSNLLSEGFKLILFLHLRIDNCYCPALWFVDIPLRSLYLRCSVPSCFPCVFSFLHHSGYKNCMANVFATGLDPSHWMVEKFSPFFDAPKCAKVCREADSGLSQGDTMGMPQSRFFF